MVDEADGVLEVRLEIALQSKRLVLPINVWLADLDEVDENSEMHDELHGDGDNETPVEDGGRWLLSVEPLQRLVEAQHHEDDRDAQAQVSRLVVAHFDTVEVERAHSVRREQTVEGKDLVLLEG